MTSSKESDNNIHAVIIIYIYIYKYIQSAVFLMQCLESTTSNRIINEARYIQCVAAFAASWNQISIITHQEWNRGTSIDYTL